MMQALGNRIFANLPTLARDHFVYCTPSWLVWLLRALTGLGAIVLGGLVWKDWASMPLAFHLLSLLLIPALLFMALSPRERIFPTKFIADQQGLYFPCNEQLVGRAPWIRLPARRDWLFVPWSRVGDLRLAEEAGDGGRHPCLAFDLRVSAAEVEAFFRYVDVPLDRETFVAGLLPVAYGDAFPRHARALECLQDLRGRSRHANEQRVT